MNDVMPGSDGLRILEFEKKTKKKQLRFKLRTSELRFGLGRSKSIFGARRGETSLGLRDARALVELRFDARRRETIFGARRGQTSSLRPGSHVVGVRWKSQHRKKLCLSLLMSKNLKLKKVIIKFRI